MLSCYDFRSELNKLSRKYGAHERAVRRNLQRIREARLPAGHIKSVEWLGLKMVTLFFNKHVEVSIDRTWYTNRIPYGEFVTNVKNLLQDIGGVIRGVINLLVPERIVDEVMSREVTLPGLVRKEVCDVVPIYSCPFVEGEMPQYPHKLSNNEIRKLVDEWSGSGWKKAYSIGRGGMLIPPRTPDTIALALMTAIDREPWLYRADVTNPNQLKLALPEDTPREFIDAIKRASKKLGNIYDSLSKGFILGRHNVWGLYDVAPIMVVVSKEQAPLLHLFASAYALSNGVVVCESIAYTVLPGSWQAVRILRRIHEQGGMFSCV
ncbi:hypothetical protein Pyrfu_0734 [Pyrolobus fumarii 1A]|uniref:Uncharacterized protein n=1 Tax=Pyrolobus fumarii (strain DSM 11204 / 1A) TaxID=694429 RepID=G0EDB8_PYRF1|nr:hypothetical protein Pyrfu_0734 [Pyrolobus fumarii 1A]